MEDTEEVSTLLEETQLVIYTSGSTPVASSWVLIGVGTVQRNVPRFNAEYASKRSSLWFVSTLRGAFYRLSLPWSDNAAVALPNLILPQPPIYLFERGFSDTNISINDLFPARVRSSCTSSSSDSIMSDQHNVTQTRHPHLSRLKAVLSTTSYVLTGVLVVTIIIMVLITIPITSLAYSMKPGLAIAPVIICMLLCCYVFSKERRLQDIIETAQSVGSSFVQSTVRKIVDNSIENTFETLMLFPVGLGVFGIIIACLGYTPVGTLAVVLAVVAVVILMCGSSISRHLASLILDSYLGTESQSSENTPLLGNV